MIQSSSAHTSCGEHDLRIRIPIDCWYVQLQHVRLGICYYLDCTRINADVETNSNGHRSAIFIPDLPPRNGRIIPNGSWMVVIRNQRIGGMRLEELCAWV